MTYDEVIYGTHPDELDKMLRRLSGEEREFIKCMYGISPYDEHHSLAEVAKILKSTKARMRVVGDRARNRLRLMAQARNGTTTDCTECNELK